MSPRFEEDNWGSITSHIYAKGIITAVYPEDDTADVTVPGYQNGSGTVIFYHCSDDAEERSNGSIEGGSAAFAVDDEVIVMCEADTGTPIRIIGFVEGIKYCGFSFMLLRDDDKVITADISTDDFGVVTFDDWTATVPYFIIINGNSESQTIYYGDEEWWEDNGFDVSMGEWKVFHRVWEDETGDYTGEVMILSYDEVTQYWSFKVPAVLQGAVDDEGDPIPGYWIYLDGVADSLAVQYLQTYHLTELPEYLYVWKPYENADLLPYWFELDEDDKPVGLVQPHRAIFHIPYIFIDYSWDPVAIPYQTLTAGTWEWYKPDGNVWDRKTDCPGNYWAKEPSAGVSWYYTPVEFVSYNMTLHSTCSVPIIIEETFVQMPSPFYEEDDMGTGPLISVSGTGLAVSGENPPTEIVQTVVPGTGSYPVTVTFANHGGRWWETQRSFDGYIYIDYLGPDYS
jgi:hypothetical protein